MLLNFIFTVVYHNSDHIYPITIYFVKKLPIVIKPAMHPEETAYKIKHNRVFRKKAFDCQ